MQLKRAVTHRREGESLLALAWRRFLWIVLAAPPDAVILGTGFMALTIGIMLAQPFDVLNQVSIYRFMARYPENVWARAFIIAGSLKVVVCLLHEPIMRSPLRYTPFALNATMFFFWLFIWAGMVESEPHSLASVVYFFVLLAPAWASVRRWRQAREVT